MLQKKTLIPMNLQFFADGEGDGSNAETVTPPDSSTPPEPDKDGDKGKGDDSKKSKEVDVQALLNEVASLRRKADKAASEASEFKKKYKETLSEKEQYDMEAAEAKAKHDEEFEALKAKVALSELKDQFRTLGYSSEMAEQAAKAQFEGDVETLIKVQKQFTDDQIEAEKQKILAEMPQPNIGAGGTTAYTKDDFEKMSMADRTKLRRENRAEYDRLLNL